MLEIQVKGFLTHTFGIRSVFGVRSICKDIVPFLSWRWDPSIDPDSVIFICRWYIQLGGNFVVFSGSVIHYMRSDVGFSTWASAPKVPDFLDFSHLDWLHLCVLENETQTS